MTRRAMPSPCCAGNAGLESYGTRDLLRAGGILLLAGAGASLICLLSPPPGAAYGADGWHAALQPALGLMGAASARR